MKDIEEEMKQIVSEQLDIKKDKLSKTSFFSKDLGADSLDIIELIMSIEEKFGVNISDEEAEKITTLQHAIDFVKKYKSSLND
ncbi:acyl carrier protein [Buchnera aphidicola]|uniref:Acyl carrier protein n=1 Tax=Buchnera aphidicola (Anoecia oenotherae) TaxID=1241833 RepID=A0A4D6XZG2_9GAMM|nr:acyl carrier protein [Buchnera aphidicola]QCI19400.1 acyl carrier protein [Buchnera aphidicola (Anoecia oenotherae)]